MNMQVIRAALETERDEAEKALTFILGRSVNDIANAGRFAGNVHTAKSAIAVLQRAVDRYENARVELNQLTVPHHTAVV